MRKVFAYYVNTFVAALTIIGQVGGDQEEGKETLAPINAHMYATVLC